MHTMQCVRVANYTVLHSGVYFLPAQSRSTFFASRARIRLFGPFRCRRLLAYVALVSAIGRLVVYVAARQRRVIQCSPRRALGLLTGHGSPVWFRSLRVLVSPVAGKELRRV